MEREQVLLLKHQAEWLRKEAYTTRKSKSQIVRELIDKERRRMESERDKKV
ncbi:MAG: hypothetical protein M0021_09755 [Clostridia bacterium]|nr:hypothetical protein [Clostridia bacterium]